MALERSHGRLERPKRGAGVTILPHLPQLSAYTARIPKTEPSCFKKRWCLDLGVFPNTCFIAKPSERSRRKTLSLLSSPLSCSVCCCQSCGTSACLFCSSNYQPAGTQRGKMAGATEGWLGHRPASRFASVGYRQLAPYANQTLGIWDLVCQDGKNQAARQRKPGLSMPRDAPALPF